MAATVRINSPVKIGIPGEADFSGATLGEIEPGHLTISGKTFAITRVRSIARGHHTITGKALTWQSTAWQYTTVTSLVSIGVIMTLYDSLDPGFGLIPSIGDIWRTPVVSQDGGTVTVSGDARFEIGAPTSGFDVLEDVLYFNLITGLWYGPADFTILDPLLTLSIQRGHLQIQGKTLMVNTVRFVQPGRLVVFGHQARFDKTRAIERGNLTITGQEMRLHRLMSVSPGHLTITGKDIEFLARLTLPIEPGHLTVAGKEIFLSRTVALEAGHLTITGKELNLFVGLPLQLEPGHLQIQGQVLRLNRAMIFQTGRLTIQGKNIVWVTTAAIGRVDKPVVNIGGKRKRIRQP